MGKYPISDPRTRRNKNEKLMSTDDIAKQFQSILDGTFEPWSFDPAKGRRKRSIIFALCEVPHTTKQSIKGIQLPAQWTAAEPAWDVDTFGIPLALAQDRRRHFENTVTFNNKRRKVGAGRGGILVSG